MPMAGEYGHLAWVSGFLWCSRQGVRVALFLSPFSIEFLTASFLLLIIRLIFQCLRL